MDDILEKLIRGEKITRKDIEYALYEVCESVHASCDNSCPVYKLMTEEEKEMSLEDGDCQGRFKDGAAMLKFIRKRRQIKDKDSPEGA